MNINDKQIDELIARSIREKQAMPEGLTERLERYIDALAAREEQQKKKRSLFFHRSFRLITGTAAAALIWSVFFFQTEPTLKPSAADTFSDQEEAAVAAQQILVFISVQLSKGLAPVAAAGKEINKANEILGKQFKE